MLFAEIWGYYRRIKRLSEGKFITADSCQKGQMEGMGVFQALGIDTAQFAGSGIASLNPPARAL
jgi:hypothetical protein